MKTLLIALCLLGPSAFAMNLDVESLENNLEEISYALENETCSTVYDDITETHSNVGKIDGAIQIIKELKPDVDLSEQEQSLRNAKIQLVQIDNEFKRVCL